MVRDAGRARPGSAAVLKAPALAPALALILALAGCTSLFEPAPPPPEPVYDEEREHADGSVATGPLCGNLTLALRPPEARAGEPVDIIASLANCGGRDLIIDRGLCPDEGSGFRLAIQRGLNEFHLHARERADAAALHGTPCVRGGSSVFGLPPSRADVPIAHVVTFRWNGTFVTDPCWPAPPGEPACLTYAPATPGTHELRARIEASGATFTGSANLTMHGAPQTGEPCANLTLDDALVLRIENCGGVDLTLDPDLACLEPYPARIEVVRGDARWALLADGRAITTSGCAPPPEARVILAGTNASASFAWDGTIDGAAAPAGEYEVVARVRAMEGGEWEARARVGREG